MFLLIEKDGSLSLRESDDMKSFCIVELTGSLKQVKDCPALTKIAEPIGDDHFWIDAEAIVQISPQNHDAQWVSRFWDMLKKVEPYGYADMTTNRVKAHVEFRESAQDSNS
ncbi:MAG: hypothetical protein ACR2QW_02700 [bacterium]